MSGSAEKAEVAVEQSRERLDRTLGSLQARLNAASLREDLLGPKWQSRSLAETADLLRATIRRNPVPLLMICAGISWLLYDAVTRSSRKSRSRVSASRHSTAAFGNGDALSNSRNNHQDKSLDEALEETFPGSDPVAVKITR